MAIESIDEVREKLRQAQRENEALRAKLKPGDYTAVQIPGTFKVNLEAPGGGIDKKTLKFREGAVRVRLKNGECVMSEHLMKLASGEALTEEELQASKHLVGVSSEEAAAWLTHLARIGASFLIPV